MHLISLKDNEKKNKSNKEPYMKQLSVGIRATEKEEGGKLSLGLTAPNALRFGCLMKQTSCNFPKVLSRP